MTEEEKRNWVQEDTNLLKYGVIMRGGPRHNQTDCEADYVLIHIPTNTAQRFHGTWYDEEYTESMYDWVMKFDQIPEQSITAEELLKFMNISLYEICDMENHPNCRRKL